MKVLLIKRRDFLEAEFHRFLTSKEISLGVFKENPRIETIKIDWRFLHECQKWRVIKLLMKREGDSLFAEFLKDNVCYGQISMILLFETGIYLSIYLEQRFFETKYI